jgi:pre-mRNA-splicing factor SYF2
MTDDLEKQIKKRKGYSRGRIEKASADVDYINERNMRFNKKIDRFYGRFTTEIKVIIIYSFKKYNIKCLSLF